MESNDRLYGGTPGYMRELGETIVTVVEVILKQLSALGERAEGVAKVNQARLVMDFCGTICGMMEVDTTVATFLVKLLDLIRRHKSMLTRNDLRYMVNGAEYMRRRVESSAGSATVSPAIRSFLQECGA